MTDVFPSASTRCEVKAAMLAAEMKTTPGLFMAVRRELNDILTNLRTSRVCFWLTGEAEEMSCEQEEPGALRIDSQAVLDGLVIVDCEYDCDYLTEVQGQFIWKWVSVDLAKSLVECGYTVKTKERALLITFGV